MDKIYIVMDYVEHDLKALMETMTQPFLVGMYLNFMTKTRYGQLLIGRAEYLFLLALICILRPWPNDQTFCQTLQ